MQLRERSVARFQSLSDTIKQLASAGGKSDHHFDDDNDELVDDDDDDDADDEQPDRWSPASR
jgi:hypothetical protein